MMTSKIRFFFFLTIYQFILLEAIAPRSVAFWEYALGCLVCSSVASLIFMRKRKEYSQSSKNMLGFLCLIPATGLLAVPFSDQIYFRHVIADLTFIALIPISFCIFYSRIGRLTRQEARSLLWVCGIGAVISPISAAVNLIPDLARGGGRFDAPQLILIAATATAIASSATTAKRVRYSVQFVFLMSLTATSGWRSYILRDLVTLAGGLGRSIPARTIQIAALLGVAGTIAMYAPDIVRLLENTRFSQLAQGRLDVSALGRLLEVQDIMEKFRLEANLANYIFGFGHGATFTPSYVIAERNIVGASSAIHHVHVSPAALILRYGVLGTIFYSYIAYVAMQQVVRIDKNRELYQQTLVRSILGLLILSLFVNVFNDALAAVLLGCWLADNEN